MGSKAQQAPHVPGPPTNTEAAYLGGLIDRGGGFTLNPVGLKIACPHHQAVWLRDRFGGRVYEQPAMWWLMTSAELRFALYRCEIYVIARNPQMKMMMALLDHMTDPDRPWHGSDEWRARRDELMALVRACAPQRAPQ